MTTLRQNQRPRKPVKQSGRYLQISQRARVSYDTAVEHAGHRRACGGACDLVRTAIEDLSDADDGFGEWAHEKWPGLRDRYDDVYLDEQQPRAPSVLDTFHISNGMFVRSVTEYVLEYEEKTYSAEDIARWPGHPFEGDAEDALMWLDAVRGMLTGSARIAKRGLIFHDYLERVYIYTRDTTPEYFKALFGEAIFPPPHRVRESNDAAPPPPTDAPPGRGRPKRDIPRGTKFGFLVVQGEAEPDAHGNRRLSCLCTGYQCGKTVVVRLDKLTAKGKGATVSCGCYAMQQHDEYLERATARRVRANIRKSEGRNGK